MSFHSSQPGLEPIHYHPGIEALRDAAGLEVGQPDSEGDRGRTFSQFGAGEPQQGAFDTHTDNLSQTFRTGDVPAKTELPEHKTRNKGHSRRILLLLIITALVVVVSGAVGGGVAGGLVHKQKHQNVNPRCDLPLQ
jgi:hypothetical protein